MLLLHLLGLYKYLTMCTSIRKTEKKTDRHMEHLHVFLKGNGLIGDNDAILEYKQSLVSIQLSFILLSSVIKGFSRIQT